MSLQKTIRGLFSLRRNDVDESIAEIVGLSHLVTIALAHAIQYLKDFSLDSIFTQRNKLIHFRDRSHMLLNAGTLSNL